MNRWIDADERITIQLYDDEHEEWREEDMTIAELLNQYTDEGCPSAKQEWIPCSERLPKDNGHYICSFVQPQRIDKIHIGLAYCDNGRWVGYNAREITAWMPLPEPWKGAKE